MTPANPRISHTVRATLRPLVAAIALGLIWMGAARMEARAQSRYTTAGALSVALIAWLAIAQYLGSANTVFRDRRDRGADPIVRIADPADYRRPWPVAIGKHRKPRLRNTAAMARGGSNLPRRGRHIPRALGGRTPALAIRAARGDRGRYDRLPCRRRGRAAGAKGGRRSQSSICLVFFWHRRPRCGDYDGGTDLSGQAHLLALDAPNLLISSYPLVMVPTFAVPLALMLHGLVLWRLRRETVPAGRLALA